MLSSLFIFLFVFAPTTTTTTTNEMVNQFAPESTNNGKANKILANLNLITQKGTKNDCLL